MIFNPVGGLRPLKDKSPFETAGRLPDDQINQSMKLIQLDLRKVEFPRRRLDISVAPSVTRPSNEKKYIPCKHGHVFHFQYVPVYFSAIYVLFRRTHEHAKKIIALYSKHATKTCQQVRVTDFLINGNWGTLEKDSGSLPSVPLIIVVQNGEVQGALSNDLTADLVFKTDQHSC